MALNAAFFQLVTIFQLSKGDGQQRIPDTKCAQSLRTHPMRPFVTWSKVENRFASRKGGSNEVDAVIPKAKLVVTAAIAEIGMVGSVIGHCAALLMQSSRLPL
jgi:hypothetical protein